MLVCYASVLIYLYLTEKWYFSLALKPQEKNYVYEFSGEELTFAKKDEPETKIETTNEHYWMVNTVPANNKFNFIQYLDQANGGRHSGNSRQIFQKFACDLEDKRRRKLISV